MHFSAKRGLAIACRRSVRPSVCLWPPPWIISNGHISATAHSIHLYSAHRAIIFAIAQLSC